MSQRQIRIDGGAVARIVKVATMRRIITERQHGETAAHLQNEDNGRRSKDQPARKSAKGLLPTCLMGIQWRDVGRYPEPA